MTDTPTATPKLGARKSRGRPPGPHSATVEHGKRIGAILDAGTPLNFVAETLDFDVRTLRKQLKAAGARPRSRDAMQAVSYAMRRLREYDEAHPEVFGESPWFFEAGTRTPEMQTAVEDRLRLTQELCRAQAAAGAEASPPREV